MRDLARGFVAWLVMWRERLLDPPAGAYPAPRPDELILCFLCLLSGIPTLLGRPPTSIDAVLWRPLLYVWASALVALPAVIIWTSLARWRGRAGDGLIDAALAFRKASLLLAGVCFVYVGSVVIRNGYTAAVAALITVGFALGRLWRAYEMRRWLERHRIQP